MVSLVLQSLVVAPVIKGTESVKALIMNSVDDKKMRSLIWKKEDENVTKTQVF